MAEPSFPQSLAEAIAFDREDPLAAFRSKFALPEGVTYLVGHSLGPATHRALEALSDVASNEWANGLVGSWNTAGWIDLPATVGARIARLLGVAEGDVITCDSVSINLFKLVGALLGNEGSQRRVLVEEGEFPTDQYILEKLSELTGARFVRTPPGTGPDMLEPSDVFVRSVVDYRTGAIADVEGVEAKARQSDAAIVWDLSHATGILNLNLKKAGAKYAVGCTYKYLNGGPGAPAFLYVDREKIAALKTPLAGWLGHARPFAFESTYEPSDGLQRFVAGTPPILSMSALHSALELFENLELSALEEKTQSLGDMCLAVFARLELPSASPPIGTRRGGHVSFAHPEGYALSRALAERGHKTDFRTPDIIRLGLSPLFLSYAEVWQTLDALEDILTTKTYRDPHFSVQAKVT